jgi:hypothetical protein
LVIYLIHAHKNIVQLNSLIALLISDFSRVYVNVDRKSDIDINQVDRRARVVDERIEIHWGAWSQVQATINSLKAIESDGLSYGHVVFISGEDFPLFSPHGIAARLEPNVDYIDSKEISPSGWAVQERYERFYYNGRSKAVRYFYRRANKIARVIGFKRKVPNGLHIYGGSSWWNLTQGTVRDILSYVERYPSVVDFFRTTLCPDEMFFQTVIHGIGSNIRRKNDNLRYLVFLAGKANPEVLMREHLDKILTSNAIFARKLDWNASSELMTEIMRVRSLKSRRVDKL